MAPLPHPDNFHLEAAQGWVMLGDAEAALAELSQLSAASGDEPEVLEIRWLIHARQERWSEALAAAERLVDRAPDRTFGWIHRAYALRRMPGGGLEKAWQVLRPAWDRFPQEYLIAYNLACYAAQMDHTDEAWEWLERAIKASGDRELIRRMARADKDLEVFWRHLGTAPES